MPDFNVKKLVKEAGSTLSRVVQVNKIQLIDCILKTIQHLEVSSKIFTRDPYSFLKEKSRMRSHGAHCG